MRILDQYIVKSFAVNFVVSLAVLLSIYVLLDLFFNFDEFTHETGLSFGGLLAALMRYYGSHLFLYFSQISGVITLFAMAFTLARLQSCNEFVAIVSSGVSLYRIALTVIVVGVTLNALWVVDQELIIPRLAPQLAQTHEAAALSKPYGVWLLPDRNGSWLSASQFDHRAGVLHRLVVMRRASSGDVADFITADRATWAASADGAGLYRLERGAMYSRKLDEEGAAEVTPQGIESLLSDLSPDDIVLRQSARWLHFLGRGQLGAMRKQDPTLAPQIAKATHGRFATPIVNMLILIIGIPIFLDRQPGKVVQSGGRCVLVCGVCFVFAFLCQNISVQGYPALMAWVPLIALTPVMVLSLDRMKT